MSSVRQVCHKRELTGKGKDQGTTVLLAVPHSDLLELGHGTLNVERWTSRARVRTGEQRSLPVLEEVEVERLTEAQAEDLEVGVG